MLIHLFIHSWEDYTPITNTTPYNGKSSNVHSEVVFYSLLLYTLLLKYLKMIHHEICLFMKQDIQ